MQTVVETRRQRFEILVKRYGHMTTLNEAIGRDRGDPQLGLYKNKNLRKNGKPHQMGDLIAREIEQALKLPEGWMDTPLSYAEIHGEDDPKAKALMVMENIPKDQWPTVLRLIDAISQPGHQPAKTGTLG